MLFSGRYSVPWKGLSNGIHHLDYEVDDEFAKHYNCPDIKTLEIKVSATIDKRNDGFEADLHLSGKATYACDRCLEDVTLPFEADDHFVAKVSEQPDPEEEIEWITPDEGEFDMSDFLMGTIELYGPSQRVHPTLEECNPDMIARFRIVSAEEFDQLAEPHATLGESGAATALERLKHKMENK